MIEFRGPGDLQHVMRLWMGKCSHWEKKKTRCSVLAVRVPLLSRILCCRHSWLSGATKKAKWSRMSQKPLVIPNGLFAYRTVTRFLNIPYIVDQCTLFWMLDPSVKLVCMHSIELLGRMATSSLQNCVLTQCLPWAYRGKKTINLHFKLE